MIDPLDPGTLELAFQEGKGALIGYARVSSAAQIIQAQIDALEAAGCSKVFTDVAERTSKDRPGLDNAVATLRGGDTLVVCKVDRFGRSLAHLINAVDELLAKGIGFRSLTETAIDTTARGGNVMARVIAELAASERERERELEQVISRAKAELAESERERDPSTGRKVPTRRSGPGRPAAVTPEVLARAKELMSQEGLSVREAAKALGVSKTPLYNALNAETEAGGKAAAPKERPS